MSLKQEHASERRENRSLVIGDGRMARHWTTYLEMLGMPCLRWARSTQDRQALTESLNVVDQVYLAISDDGLEDFHDEHLRDFSGTVHHFSGCHVSERMHGCHPLMTFGTTPYEEASYRRMTLVLEDSDEATASRFSEFPNPLIRIPAESKPLYHALCVMSCNFPQILWSRTLSQFEQLGIAADNVLPLLSVTLENSVSTPGGSITGPLARGDRTTMDSNLQALDSEQDRELYRSFMKLMGC